MARYICYPSTRTERFGIEYGGLFIIHTQQKDVIQAIDNLSRISFNTRHRHVANKSDFKPSYQQAERYNIYSAMFPKTNAFFVLYRDIEIGLKNYALNFSCDEIEKRYFPVPEHITVGYSEDTSAEYMAESFYPPAYSREYIDEHSKYVHITPTHSVITEIRNTYASAYAESYVQFLKNQTRRLMVGLPQQLQMAFERGYLPNSHVNSVGIMFSDTMNNGRPDINTSVDMPSKLFTTLNVEEPEFYNRRVFSTVFPVNVFVDNMSKDMVNAEER
tara:strand:- start:3852 stop:4673 length:822 start_codon:yes stop_codon:yes gene_type:complete